MKEILIKDCNEKVYEYTAKSGLKVYIWPYTLSEEIDLSLTVNYGSIHQKFKIGNKKYEVPSGVAHYLEHLKFNEKKDFTAHEYYYKLGSYTNAYTTYDHTSYEVSCHDNLEDNLAHLLYFVYNPYFTKELVDKERNIIAEECRMSLDNPYTIGYESMLKGVFHKNHKKDLVVGSLEDIKRTTLDDVLLVFDTFYHPKNMFLTVTGNIEPLEVIRIVDKYFEENKFPKYLETEFISEKEADGVVTKYQEIMANVTKEKYFASFKVSKKPYKRMPKLKLNILLNVLMNINFGQTSAFNDHVIKNFISDDFNYSFMIEDSHILFNFECTTSYPKEISKMIKEKMQNLELNEEDFQRKIKVLVAMAILGYEDSNEVNSDIRLDVIKYGKIVDDVKSVVKKLSLADLEAFVSKMGSFEAAEVLLKPSEIDK